MINLCRFDDGESITFDSIFKIANETTRNKERKKNIENNREKRTRAPLHQLNCSFMRSY